MLVNEAMKKSTRLVALGAALVLSGIFVTALSLSHASAQDQKIDLEKLKQILNETRNAIEANDDPGALTQLDMADQLLSGNTTAGANTTNTTAIVTG
jgi:hypothetical protein